MASKKCLLNAPDTLVLDSLRGLIAANEHLALLDCLPEIKVVLDARQQRQRDRVVAVIGGGGSGHEPAQAGYVGQGMLSAAVCGEVFASPPAAAVLAAILAVTGKAGALLIVTNYTGDRIAFGLAAEQAKAAGLAVEVAFVGEDCAIDAPGLAGRRGLAGVVFVEKLAGAAAAAGKPLAEVVELARRAAASMGTLGLALTTCTLPGQAPSERLGAGDLELGLGLHGEPGHQVVPWAPVRELVPRMLAKVMDYPLAGGGRLGQAAGGRLALMVNNLGATPKLEAVAVAAEAVAHLTDELKVQVVRLYNGHFITSLDMAGVSLTLMDLPPEWEALLDADCDAPAWPRSPGACVAAKAPVPLPPGAGGAGEEAAAGGVCPGDAATAGGRLLGRCLEAVCQALLAEVDHLNEMDRVAGDADAGDTMRAGASAVAAALQAGRYPLDDACATLRSLAATVRLAMGGTSGGLYDVALTAAAAAMAAALGAAAPAASEGAGVAAWAAALAAACGAVQTYGGAGRGDRTMMDALLPASEALRGAAAAGTPAGEAAAAVAAAGRQGAESTQGMAAHAGRASYVPTAALGATPDPGAHAVAVWLEALAAAVAAE